MLATLLAHADAGRPVCQLKVPDLRPETIGYLIAFFETACAVSAMLLGVNPFDQPGVEAYKQNLFAIMGRPGYEALTKRLSARI
jgi:glucose-6-phosphate isomerase